MPETKNTDIQYFNYEELTRELQALAKSEPELAKLESLGKTPEGRDIWILTLGGDFDRNRPAMWIDGNMHAAEVTGTSVCVAFARSMLKKLSGWKKNPPNSYMDKIQSGILYYIVPRISPDGAEAFMSRCQLVRSAPRDSSLPPTHEARWIYEDLNGDGKIQFMRQKHPDGNYVEDSQRPGLLRPRTIEDNGPFYRLFREGRIENFDGQTIPGTGVSTRNWIDLNRNFPFNWNAPHQQHGAGDYPGSEPEAKAVIDFAVKHPNIFAWVNYHCFGGVYIRPLGDKPDAKMNQSDLELYKLLGMWTEQHTGYRMVSGYHEFLYEPEKPIYGDLSEWAFNHRGAIAMVCELWDIFKRMGVESKPMIESYENFGAETLAKFYDWDKSENDGRGFSPWKSHKHPQLGEVEIGGTDTRWGVWNPPHKFLSEVCQNQIRFLEKLCSLAPDIHLEKTAQTALPGGLTEISVRVRNEGYLPSHILSSAEALTFNEDIILKLELSGSLKLESGDAAQKARNLGGWGLGKAGWSFLPVFAGSPGNAYEKTCRWVLSGSGQARVSAGNRRCGFQHLVLEL